MTRFFAGAAGKYLGAWTGVSVNDAQPGEGALATVPAGAIEVAAAPDDVRQTWDGTAWSAPPTPDPIPLSAEELYDIFDPRAW